MICQKFACRHIWTISRFHNTLPSLTATQRFRKQNDKFMTAAISKSQNRPFSSEISETSSYLKSGNSVVLQGEKYTTFYKFRYIVAFRMFNRLKLYQTGFTVLLVPAMSYLNSIGHVDSGTLTYTIGICGFAMVMLYLSSIYTRRIIGQMHLSEDLKTVMVSHLTFWGNRRDVPIPVDDVVSFSELYENSQEILVRFRRYSTQDYLFYFLKYADILDKDKFIHVFGEIM